RTPAPLTVPFSFFLHSLSAAAVSCWLSSIPPLPPPGSFPSSLPISFCRNRTPASHPRVLPQPHQCRLPSFAAVRRRGPLQSSPTLSIFFQSLAVEVFWVGPTPGEVVFHKGF
ncbi:hypothetical protein SDJN02_08316, partial [Cucurbita argyrosperma subsp. argyrosperma]